MNKSTTLLMILIVLAACKKETIEQPNPRTLSESEKLLTSHSWRMAEIYVYLKDGTLSPVLLPSCYYDDEMTFNPDYTYKSSNGLELCPNQTNDIETGQWEIKNDDTQLLVTDANYTRVWDITLSADSLMTYYYTPSGKQACLYLKK